MNLFYPSIYLNFSVLNSATVVAWDNKNLKVLSEAESQTFIKLQDGETLAADTEQLRCCAKLLKDNVLSKGLPPPRRRASEAFFFQTSQCSFIFQNSDLEAPVEGLYSLVVTALPALKDVHLVFTDNILQSTLGPRLAPVATPILFINPFSSTPVVGPCLKGIEDLPALQAVLGKTWSTAVYEQSLTSYRRASVHHDHLRSFLQALSRFDHLLDHLSTHIQSYDPREELQSHEILWELAAPPENLSAEEFHAALRREDPILSLDGGMRVKKVEEVCRILERYHDPITGIADVVDEHEVKGLHIFRAFSYLQFLLRGPFINLYSMGKGNTRSQSYASCMAELLERFFSFSAIPAHESIRAHERDISPAVKAEDLILYSPRQLRSPPIAESFFCRIPAAYDGSALDWVKLHSLSSHEATWFPRDFCYNPPGKRSKFFIPTSNGVATGNTYAEAIAQGAFELIERDAAAIWWYNKVPRSQLPLEDYDFAALNSCRAYYDELGFTLRVLDITSDIAVPCYVALAYHATTPGTLQLGLGCHLDPRAAIARALTELMQSEVARKTNPAHRALYSLYFEKQNYDETFLNPAARGSLPTSDVSYARLSDVLSSLTKIFQDAGHDLYVLNFSLEHHPMKVIRVVSPGLRSMMYELGEGRLYSVPKDMGHLETRRLESELNTVPLDI